MSNRDRSFDRLLAEAASATMTGWDFSHLAERWIETAPPWDYRELVRSHLPSVESLLDLGTGGGELLGSLAPLPPRTSATEGYAPNIAVARARLEPLSVTVIPIGDDDRLPLPDASYDLVIDRHESYDPAELFRVLKSGGTFLTQQVGGRDNIELNRRLQPTVELSFPHWCLDYAVAALRRANFEILNQREAFPAAEFRDIGAIVHFLRATPWQIPDFSLETHRARLRALHDEIERTGSLRVHSHRFLIEARKP
jgi:SAM-dependent methyltransferase